jgi:hypothetical protein
VIANGYGITVAPGIRRPHLRRPGVIYRHVTGVGPSQVRVAWARTDDTNPVIQDFVRCCLDSRPPQPAGYVA